MNVRTTAFGKVHAQNDNGGLCCMGEGSNVVSLVFSTDDPVTCLACLRHLARPPKPDLRSCVHAFMDSATGELFISAYQCDDPQWEANHIVLKDARGSRHESVLNVLRNVLEQAQVTLCIDE